MENFSYTGSVKTEARKRLWTHAVQALTTRRAESCCVPRSHVRDLQTHYATGGGEGGCLPSDTAEAKKLKEETILQWETIHDRHVGSRDPSELAVLYLAGPEPLNDYQVLCELGVHPNNIWAVETNEAAFEAGLEQLRGAKVLDINFFHMDVGTFLVSVPQTFDIIYLDFTKSILSHVHDLVLLFAQHRLRSPGVLITNFCVPPQDDLVPLVTTYLASKNCFLSSTGEAVYPIENGWQPYTKDDKEAESLQKLVEEHFEHYYGEFVTLLLADIGAILVPFRRLYLKRMGAELSPFSRFFDLKKVKGDLRTLRRELLRDHVAPNDPRWERIVDSDGSLYETDQSMARFLYNLASVAIAPKIREQFMLDVLGPNHEKVEKEYVLLLMLALENPEYHEKKALTTTFQERLLCGKASDQDLLVLGLHQFPREVVEYAVACLAALATFNNYHQDQRDRREDEGSENLDGGESEEGRRDGTNQGGGDGEDEEDEEDDKETFFDWFNRRFDSVYNGPPYGLNVKQMDEYLKEELDEAMRNSLRRVRDTFAALSGPVLADIWYDLISGLEAIDIPRHHYHPFCDVFIPEDVSLDMLIGFLAYPALPSRQASDRFAYTDKTNRMLVDSLVFDECRYLYGAFPVGELFMDALLDPSRQLCLRFVRDGLRRCLCPHMNEWAMWSFEASGSFHQPIPRVALNDQQRSSSSSSSSSSTSTPSASSSSSSSLHTADTLNSSSPPTSTSSPASGHAFILDRVVPRNWHETDNLDEDDYLLDDETTNHSGSGSGDEANTEG